MDELEERRSKDRRGLDDFLKQINLFLDSFIECLEKSKEAGEAKADVFRNLVSIRDSLGRRKSDKFLAYDIISKLEKIAAMLIGEKADST